MNKQISRIKNLQKILRQKEIDACIISNLLNPESNMDYYLPESFEHSLLIIPKKGNSKFLVSKMEYDRALAFVKDYKVVRFEKPIHLFLAKHIKTYKTIAINKNVMALNEYNLFRKGLKELNKNSKQSSRKFVDAYKNLEYARIIKDQQEISLISKACCRRHPKSVFRSPV